MKVCAKLCLALAAIALPICAMGAANTLPYQEEFDQPTGTDITVVLGWSGASAYVSNISYSYGGTKPIGAADTGVLAVDVGLDSGVTNEFTMDADQIVWADFMTSVNQIQGTNSLSVPGDTQVAFAVNTNNHLYLYHNDSSQSGATWTEFADTAVSDQWVRVSVKLDYSAGGITPSYFQIYLDGTAMTNAAGYSASGGTTTPGSWFVMGSSANTFMTNFIVSGKGWLDELVVSTNEPNFGAAPQYTANGTYIPWLDGYGLGDDTGDPDGDGFLTWEEYILGNNPTNADTFIIANQYIANGSNILEWASSTAGAQGPYQVERSTNLVVGGWDAIAWPARTPPTNVWGEALLGYPAYYRVSATNQVE